MFVLMVVLILLSGLSYSQISHGGLPFKTIGGTKTTAEVLHLNIDTTGLADLKVQAGKEGPLKFAISGNVDIDPANSGTWYFDNQGTAVWQVRLKSPGAKSLHLVFDHFDPPIGARLFLFSPDRDLQLGAFTAANSNQNKILVTQPVPGDELVVQYQLPEKLKNQAQLNISQVGHGFLDLFGSDADKLGFMGPSGPCNVDVNCPEGENWQDQKRSVVKLFIDKLVGFDEVCTGVLMNNTAEDGKPYILTASHCIIDGVDASRTVFLFDYESPVCDGPDGFTDLSISGSILRATTQDLDFSLTELNDYPPIYYKPYYAGWNTNSSPPSSSVSIHHPSGDVKKISVDNDPAETANWLDYDPDAFWRILIWDVGTTEPGSSGGPLFDPNGLVVGTLAGGQAQCGNSINDYYQKYSEAWDRYASPATQLKAWLDPINSGVESLAGYDPYGPDNLTCDTLYNIGELEQLVLEELNPGVPSDGLWTGHNVDSITQYAERMDLQTGDEFAELVIQVGQVKTNSAIDSVEFRLWNGDQKPESLLVSKKYPLLYFQDTTEYIISLDTVIQFTGRFWAGYRISYDGPVSGPLMDQFSLFQAEPRSGSGENTAVYYSNDQWYAFDTSSASLMKTSLAIKARMCSDIPKLSIDDLQDPGPGVDVKLFPNPASNALRLELPAYEDIILEIHSYTGNILFKRSYPNSSGEILLNLENFKPGFYILKIRGESYVVSRKFLVIR